MNIERQLVLQTLQPNYGFTWIENEEEEVAFGNSEMKKNKSNLTFTFGESGAHQATL